MSSSELNIVDSIAVNCSSVSELQLETTLLSQMMIIDKAVKGTLYGHAGWDPEVHNDEKGNGQN